jgi:hypothetical protein
MITIELIENINNLSISFIGSLIVILNNKKPIAMIVHNNKEIALTLFMVHIIFKGVRIFDTTTIITSDDMDMWIRCQIFALAFLKIF